MTAPPLPAQGPPTSGPADPPVRPPRAGARQWLALVTLMLPVLLVSVDGTVLTFALPAIAAALRPTGVQQLWVVDVYSLVLAGLLVTTGNLGDRFGRRRLLLIGGVGFGVVSAAAAFAQTPGQLIAARALLGVFGATLMPSTLSLLRAVFADRDQRRVAFAVWAAAFAGGAALGPVVGGWLLERYWWGSVMLLGVPVMVVLVVVGPLLLPESRGDARSPVDLRSVGLSTVAMASLVYGLKVVAEGRLLLGLAAVAGGAVLGALFVRRQQRLAHPLLDLSLFAVPVFRACVLANLMSILAMYGLVYCVAQYLQLVLALPPVTAGLLLVPGLAVGAAAGLGGALLARRFALERLVVTGLVLSAGGYALAAQLGTASPVLLVVAASVVLQAGVGLAETLTNDAILSTAPPERTSAASAISETAYEVGAVLGTAVLGSVLNAVYRARVQVPPQVAAAEPAGADLARETLGGAVAVAGAGGPAAAQALLASARAAFTTGLTATAWAGAGLVVAAAVVVHLQLRQRPAHPAPVDERRGTARPPASVAGVDQQRTVELYGRNRLHVRARVTGAGAVVIDGQDLSATWPRDHPAREHEYALTVAPGDVPRLVEALGGSPGDDVLDLLAARGEEVVTAGELTWLGRHGLVAELWSRVEVD